MLYAYAEVILLGARGEVLKVVKTQVLDVLVTRKPVGVETDPAGWRKYEPARAISWSLRLDEDSKMHEETNWCGSVASHGFHRYADQWWCNGYSAEQQYVRTLMDHARKAMEEENVPAGVIQRVTNRFLFGQPSGAGAYVSAKEAALEFSVTNEEAKKLVEGNWTVDEPEQGSTGSHGARGKNEEGGGITHPWPNVL